MWQSTVWIAVVLGCAGCAADNTAARCGDGILDADEACDGALISTDFLCSDGQHPTGCNACVPECPPSSCGNGVIDDPETCDGTNVPACPSGMVGAVTCTAMCEADLSACVPGDSIIVHVVEGTVDRPGTYVVSHSANGTPLTECTTDAAGLCVFTGTPANAMVTIGYARSMGSVETQYLTTFTYVTAPQRIEVVIPPPGTVIMPIGTAQVYVPGAYTGATTAATMNGCTERESADFTAVQEHSFSALCVDANQEGGVYGEARDGSGTPLAWSYLRKPIPGDTTFTLPAWSASFSTLTTQITNVPSASQTLRLDCNVTLDNLVPLARWRDVNPPTSTETFAASVPTSLTTFARCAVHVGLSSLAAQFCEQRQTPPFTTFAFDGNNLLPPLTSTFTANPFNPIDAWTCTFTSQPTPTADVSDCFKGFSRGGVPSTLIGWHLIGPGSLVGTLTAPRLGPSSPFSFSNVQVPGPGFEHANRYNYSDVTSYSDYLDGRVVPVIGETCAVFHSPN